MKPIIGITTDSEHKGEYYYQKLNMMNSKAVSDNGGIPFMFQITSDEDVIDSYLEMVDGILFTGGDDINPLYYDEEPIKEIGQIDYDRDEFETRLYKKAVLKDIPILGICRGSQIMNISEGGALYQDIYSQRQGTNSHNNPIFGSYEYHNVKIEVNSKLYEMINKSEIKINSYHHQGVKKLGDGYKATAHANDGIIECIESEKLTFAVGIQWHPEVMYKKFPVFNNIFSSFIKECENYRIRK